MPEDSGPVKTILATEGKVCDFSRFIFNAFQLENGSFSNDKTLIMNQMFRNSVSGLKIVNQIFKLVFLIIFFKKNMIALFS